MARERLSFLEAEFPSNLYEGQKRVIAGKFVPSLLLHRSGQLSGKVLRCRIAIFVVLPTGLIRGPADIREYEAAVHFTFRVHECENSNIVSQERGKA